MNRVGSLCLVVACGIFADAAAAAPLTGESVLSLFDLSVSSSRLSAASRRRKKLKMCKKHGTYDECMLLDPAAAATFVREAYSGAGDGLSQFARELGTTPATLQRAIIVEMPAKPTSQELEELLGIIGPGLP